MQEACALRKRGQDTDTHRCMHEREAALRGARKEASEWPSLAAVLV